MGALRFGHLDERGEGRMPRRGDAVLADLHPADLGDLLAHLRRRRHAAMPGLGALRELQLHHLDLQVGRDAREFLRAETAVLIAATEIARADLPDEDRKSVV